MRFCAFSLFLWYLNPTSTLSFQSVPSTSGFTIGKNAVASRSTVSSSTKLYLDGQGMAGGTRHLLGDVLRSLQPRYIAQVGDAIKSNMNGMENLEIIEFMNQHNTRPLAPDWDDIAKGLSELQTPEERSFRDDIRDGNGKPSALATRRLFGSKKPLVTLYRDSASWCPYCQKVWIALEEKQVPYEVVKIDMNCYGSKKPSEFLDLQPSGNLPCAVINDDIVIRESNEIIDALDSLKKAVSRGPMLRPPHEEERIRELCDNGRESLERRLYARWMWYLTGVRKPQEYKQIYEEHLMEVENALSESSGPFFLGKEISVVDIRFIPFLERQIASLAYFKGYNVRDATVRPNLVKWLETMEMRASYQATKSDYFTHSRALPPQLAAECAFDEDYEEKKAVIDSMSVGIDHRGWTEPGWEWCRPDQARREAVERLIAGHKQITAFCARGAGLSGFPVASAPLADPLAVPNEAVLPAIDLILRFVASSLLNRTKSETWFQQDGSSSRALSYFQETAKTSLDDDTSNALADCIDYLRARIGVPRDMSYPAAQELRAELLAVSRLLRRNGETTGSSTETTSRFVSNAR